MADHVGAALEVDPPALHLRGPRSRGAEVVPRRWRSARAVEAREVVVDAHGAGGAQADVQGHLGRVLGRSLRLRARGQDLRGDVVAAGVDGLPQPPPSRWRSAASRPRRSAGRRRPGCAGLPASAGPCPPRAGAGRRRRGGPRQRRARPRCSARPPASLPFTPSRLAPASVKRTVPVSSSRPWGKPRTRRPAPARRRLPASRGSARVPVTATSSRPPPKPRSRGLTATSPCRSASPETLQVEGAVAEKIGFAPEAEVGALGDDVEVVDLERSVLESRIAPARSRGPHTRGRESSKRLHPDLPAQARAARREGPSRAARPWPRAPAPGAGRRRRCAGRGRRWSSGR